MQQTNKTNAPSHIMSKCDKFNAYAIKVNEHNTSNNTHNQYVFEQEIIKIKEPQKVLKSNELQEQQIKGIKIVKQSQQISKCLISQLSYPIHQAIPTIKKSETYTECQQSDFAQIWDQVESIHEKNTEQRCIENRKKVNTNENNTNEAELNGYHNDENICEMMAGRFQGLNKRSQQSNIPLKAIDNTKVSTDPVIGYNQNKSRGSSNIFEQNYDEPQAQSWGSWTEIVEQLEKQHEKNKEKQKPSSQTRNIFQKGSNSQSIQSQQTGNLYQSIDILQPQGNNYNAEKLSTNEQNRAVGHKQTQCLLNYEDSEVFGPFKFNIEFYDIYGKFNIKRVQELEVQESSNKFGENQLKIISRANKNLRKINWQIEQQRKEETKMNKNGKISVSEHGKDFCIYDHVKFLANPSVAGTRLYFGIRSFNNSKDVSQADLQDTRQHIKLKDYLYLSSTGQCLLQTIHHKLQNTNTSEHIHKFDIIQSLTQQKIGSCQRTIQLQRNNKMQQTYVRRYNPYLQCQCDYLGMISSKISKIGSHYYCDITIHIPKTQVYHKQDFCKYSQELQFKVSPSENENVLVPLGICNATNSITNCILFNQSNTIEFMMATIDQQIKQVSFITRFSGISPLVGFAAAVSRQLFVSYPKL